MLQHRAQNSGSLTKPGRQVHTPAPLHLTSLPASLIRLPVSTWRSMLQRLLASSSSSLLIMLATGILTNRMLFPISISKQQARGTIETMEKPFSSTPEGPLKAADLVVIKSAIDCLFVPGWSSQGCKAYVALVPGTMDGLNIS